ncbi:hypothetical protein J4219_01470 [Candidatus Woesearchaeota archaeon]|nr:hypothetical protein [Candidatus Woesearchaeota archaeon]
MTLSPESQASQFARWTTFISHSNIKLADIIDLGALKPETAEYISRLIPLLRLMRFSVGDSSVPPKEAYALAGSYQTVDDLASIARQDAKLTDQQISSKLQSYETALENICRDRRATVGQRVTTLMELNDYLHRIVYVFADIRRRYQNQIDDD